VRPQKRHGRELEGDIVDGGRILRAVVGAWHVVFSRHGSMPRVIVKKSLLSMDCGTDAEYSGVARLRILGMKLATKLMSLNGGRVGLKSSKPLWKELVVEGIEPRPRYSRMPLTVVLSK
jgi:hypothetical protein